MVEVRIPTPSPVMSDIRTTICVGSPSLGQHWVHPILYMRLGLTCRDYNSPCQGVRERLEDLRVLNQQALADIRCG